MSKISLLPVNRPGVMVLTRSGRVHRVDELLCRAMGLEPEALVGSPLTRILAKEDRTRFRAALARALMVQSAVAGDGAGLELTLPGLGEVRLTLVPEAEPADGRVRVDCAVHAGAARPAQERSVMGGDSTADVFRAAFDYALEPMLLVNGSGAVVHANFAAARFFGRQRHALERLSLDALAAVPRPGQGLLATFRAALDAGVCQVEAPMLAGVAAGNTVEWRLSRLPGGEQMLVSPRDMTEERRRQAQERYLTQHDQLTGLCNREAFQNALDEAVARWLDSGERAPTVALIDLDSFREVNGAFGNRTGDDVLRVLAERLVVAVREEDVVARLSGDVFAVLMRGVDMTARPELARRLLDCVAEPVAVAGQDIYLSACLGMASASGRGGGRELVYAAEVALNQARHRGRDVYIIYSDHLAAPGIDRLRTTSELRLALQRQEFELHYQPQVAADSGNLVGLEALLRWHHPEHGLVAPSEFIPLLEESSLILPVGEWVLEQACTDLARLAEMGFPGLRMAVNLSPRQLDAGDFAERVSDIVKAAGVAPGAIELELTESLFLNPTLGDDSVLERLAGQGLRLAVDDFGTGYSALAYLKRLPVHCLKIDKCFVQGVGSCNEDQAIVNAVCAMAAQLGLDIVAEGVETQAQLDFLRERQGVVAQGFYYAPALPFPALARRIQWERQAIRLAS